MGYYTDYNLSVEVPDWYTEQDKSDLLDEIHSMGVFSDSQFTGNDNRFFDFYENAKWYECEKDMTYLSSLFPDAVFTLSGTGEEWEDIWTYYYKNGMVQRDGRIIISNPFDESKLEYEPVPDDSYQYSYGDYTSHRSVNRRFSQEQEITEADEEAICNILAGVTT